MVLVASYPKRWKHSNKYDNLKTFLGYQNRIGCLTKNGITLRREGRRNILRITYKERCWHGTEAEQMQDLEPYVLTL